MLKILSVATAITLANSAVLADEPPDNWKPENFGGAFVTVSDQATGGCWTNINEATTYLEDQLRLIGFEVVEEPDFETNPDVFFEENLVDATLVIYAQRWNGLCLGQFQLVLWGNVSPIDEPNLVVRNPIGWPLANPMYDRKNLNIEVLDEISKAVSVWHERLPHNRHEEDEQ